MEFVLANKYTKPGKTVVIIQCDVPFTYYEREFEGDLMGEVDDVLIKKVLDLALVELDPSGAVAKLQETAKQDQDALKEATNNLKVTSDAVMELTTTFASDIDEIKERLHALDGKGEVEEDTEEHLDEAPQPVVTTEEKHEETPQPTATVATEPTVPVATTVTPVGETAPVATPVAETPVQPAAEPQPVVTPTAETTTTPTETTVVPTTTAQGDDNHETNGKVEEHNAETTTSRDNING